MTESIIDFPKAKPPEHRLCETKDGLSPFSTAWCCQNSPLFNVALELLSASESDFQERFEAVGDTEGQQMLRSLVDAFDELHSHIADVAAALGAASERITLALEDGL